MRFAGLFLAMLLPVTVARAQSPACTDSPAHRQLDFWIGEWKVLDGDSAIGTSSIRRDVEACAIHESYAQPGFSGKSMSFFDSTLGRWRQTWVDSGGNVSEFAGEFVDGAMRFEGESHRRDGSRVLRRMTLYDLGPDRVRQHSERSVDGGERWTLAYDYTYVRME